MQFSKIKLQMIKEKNYNYNSKKIKSAIDIVKYVNGIEQLDKATEENIILICLDSKNKILSYTEIAKGGVNFCNVDFKTIFKTVFLCNASKIILIHNHPSGNAEPSRDDINITRRLLDMAKLMDVQLLDHIVIGDDDFVSCM